MNRFEFVVFLTASEETPLAPNLGLGMTVMLASPVAQAAS
jgi:hypothetical protein